MVYAEYEPYLSLPLDITYYEQTYTKKSPMTESESSAEERQWNVIAQTKCQKLIKKLRRSFTVIKIIRGENVNQEDLCQ